MVNINPASNACFRVNGQTVKTIKNHFVGYI